MHILNFLICLLLPYLARYGVFGPTQNLVPYYFSSNDAVWIAAGIGANVGFWLGILRNFVGGNSRLEELGYQKLLWLIMFFLAISKIILAVPHMWFTGAVGFILGYLSIGKGNTVGKYSLWLMLAISILIISYFSFVLIMVAWCKKSIAIFYYYPSLLKYIFLDYVR